ncbi:hypothetical protein [Weissella hellenica]|uniref:Uncharacterized protein n=1 Tax=Weissella hellenica TaxID=46256 RepID=A0A4Y4G213_WEIHE|nr:hypothetical protein [Weissella hellenica]NKY67339.1 hypothetical protein [Weissella hellenica]GED36422.1 hypothetical protein WHE01_13260 [Weissella hellenica]SCC03701.1 hypothetical protein GA0061075_1126 [Weissella hellenica]
MQQWWQKKIIIGAGMIGSLLLILQSVLGTVAWSTYKIGPYPIAMLTAKGTPYELGFRMLQLIAGMLILVTLISLIKYAVVTKKSKFNRSLRWLSLIWLIWMVLQFVWPITLDVAITVTPISVRDVVFGLVIIGLGVSLIQLGRSAQANQFESLSNAVTLLGILYILFNFLTYVVTLLGWPVNGFLDVIANDVIAVAMGFVSWYFMRLAES